MAEIQRVSWVVRFRKSRPIRTILKRLIDQPEQSIAGLVIFTLVVGSIFYHLVEGWNPLDSVYFCVITLTTIGYGDFSPKTDFGKLFTIFYAFTGIGLLATFIQLRAQQRLERKKRLSAGTKKEIEELAGIEEILPHDP